MSHAFVEIPLGVGCLLDRRLQGLGQAQADPRRQLLADRAGALARRVDEDELGLLAREANLDVAGRELRVQLERGLGEEVEELQPQVRAERVAEPPCDLGGALVPELCEPLEILLQPFQYDRQIHDDVTMTSPAASVKHQGDMSCTSGANPLQCLTQPQRDPHATPTRVCEWRPRRSAPPRCTGRTTLDRGRQWRSLARTATAVAVLTSPVVFTWFYLHQQLDFRYALLLTVIEVAAFRGLVDLLFRRFIETPSLFGDREREPCARRTSSRGAASPSGARSGSSSGSSSWSSP